MAARIDKAVTRIVLLSAVIATTTGGLIAQGADEPLRAFLQDGLGFSARDLRDAYAGRALAKIADTTLRQEVAVLGIVRIEVSKEFFLEQYRSIETFEGGTDRVPQIGRFRDPPTLEDLARLTLDEDDLRALSRCRVGDCDVKLPAAEIARFRNGVDWHSPNAPEQANRLMRQMLLDVIEAYQQRGNGALGSYQDHDRPIGIAQELRAMLGNDPTLRAYLPEFQDDLNAYPTRHLTDAEDFFYWSKVSFGLKPTIRANHVTIYRVPGSGPIAYAMASKQLYSSHYFNTALELRLLVDDTERAENGGFFLVNVNRSRSDGLTGFSGRIIRPTILSRTRDGMIAYLRHSKQTLEAQFGRRRR